MTKEENLRWLNQEIHTWENECQSKLNEIPTITEQDIVKPVLDKIRAEIEQLRPNLRPEQMTDYDYAMVDAVNDIVAIIDKYRAESEVKANENEK